MFLCGVASFEVSHSIKRRSHPTLLSRLASCLEGPIWQPSQCLCCTLTWRNPGDVVAQILHESYSLVVVRVLEAHPGHLSVDGTECV